MITDTHHTFFFFLQHKNSMSKVKPRVDTTQAPPAKEDKKDESQSKSTNAEADKNDGPGEMDVD